MDTENVCQIDGGIKRKMIQFHFHLYYYLNGIPCCPNPPNSCPSKTKQLYDVHHKGCGVCDKCQLWYYYIKSFLYKLHINVIGSIRLSYETEQ